MKHKIILSILSIILIQLPFSAHANDSYKQITLQSDYNYPGYCTTFDICFNTAEKTIALHNGKECNANNYNYSETVDVSTKCKTTHKAQITGFTIYGQTVFLFYGKNILSYYTQTNISILNKNTQATLSYTPNKYSVYNSTTKKTEYTDVSYDDYEYFPATDETVEEGKYCSYRAYNPTSQDESESDLTPEDPIPALTSTSHIVYIELEKKDCPKGYYCPAGNCFENKTPCPPGKTTKNSGATDYSECTMTDTTQLCDKNGCFTLNDL